MFVDVLTYNMSWATQVNKVLGSEADFVEACQGAYSSGGLQCTENAIKNIGKLGVLSLICLQEVNSDLEGRIEKVQPTLTQHLRGTVGLSTVSTMWDPDIFGTVIHNKVINLVDNEDRPCLFIVLKKEEQIFVVINVHMPWGDHHKTAIKNMDKYIKSDSILQDYLFDKQCKIIMMGDFNDSKTTITKYKPFLLNNKTHTVRLKHNKTKKKARKTLKSCCWHKAGHQYKNFSDTGDYVLVNKNIKQKNIKIPDIFKRRGRNNRLFSDHKPVISRLKI